MAKLDRVNFMVKFKRGLRTNLLLLVTTLQGAQGQSYYTTDTKNLFIHDGTIPQPIQSLDMSVTYEDSVVCNSGEVVFNY